jgi:hypothetical protein
MQAKSVTWALIFLGLQVGLILPAFGRNAKVQELNRRLEDITSLQLIIAEKIDLARERIAVIKDQIRLLAREIDSPEADADSRRSGYNLQLIQQLYVYRDGMEAKTAYLENGQSALDYCREQVKDDLLLIAVLDDMQVADLMAEIDRLLAVYTPMTRQPLLHVERVPKREPDWIRNHLKNPK